MVSLHPRTTIYYELTSLQGLMRPILPQPRHPGHRFLRLGQGRQGEPNFRPALILHILAL